MQRVSGHILSGATVIAVFAGAAPIAAQSGESISREVVQPLPPPEVSDLGDALRRLARDSRNVDALIDAGNASLELNDIEAAIGFFGRAQELSPASPRVKQGLAGAFVRSGRPVEALRLFAEAEGAGVSTATLASERGLAYDLVGDNAAAQAQYRRALAAGEDHETVRRLAISHAIAGDRTAFEKTLYPQLAREDFAGFRARAFGLAILGDEEEAVAIAEAVMPRDLSARIAPYLRYMGRLTKAQQAAAANLGAFPRAAQIGRDDPRIAQYIGNSSTTSQGDTRLAPAGEPLGPRNAVEQSREDSPRRVASAAGQRTFDPRQRVVPQAQRQTDPARGVSPDAAAPAVVSSASAPTAGGELPPASQPTPRNAVSQPVVQSLPEPAPAQSPDPATTAPPPTESIAMSAGPVSSAPVLSATPSPGFDLAAVPGGETRATPQPSAAASVADAFAEFRLGPPITSARSEGAVDITLIEPPREVKEEPPAEPTPPAHPRRFWVQVATGRDVTAFKYDWRRISRKAPEILEDFEPMTTPWVEANRLLAGPFETEKAAEDAVAKLREAGLDSFTFTSEEGQEITSLK